jgi:hypothetical protein
MQSLSPDTVDAALAAVFDRPEFAQRESPAVLRLISDLVAAFRQWIASLIGGWLPDRWQPAFTWIVIGLLAALAAWALYALVSALVGSRTAGRAPAHTTLGVAVRGENADWWESAARAAAAAGQFRDAAIALYLATVLRLEERGVLRYHPAKTPGDYRSELRSHPDSRRPFEAFIRQFLPVAFGARAPDGAAFRALATSASELGVNG